MAHLHSLFLKPSLRCTARCDHCGPRRAFYRTRTGNTLTLNDYRGIIREAKSLGAESLHISGGEPTLYPQLAELVSEGRRAHMFTVLNTNGSLVTRDYARDLLKCGLDSSILSLHSHRRGRHDSIRKREGNFDEVINAVNVFRELRDMSHPRFIISTQTIVTRSNYVDLPGIIDLVCGLDVDAHGISYLEGDFGLEDTPTVDDIAVLRDIIIPDVVRRLGRHKFKNLVLRYAAIRLVSGLYGGDSGRRQRMSAGVFSPNGTHGRCRTPKGFMMILADGSALPCNMVEYTGGPVLGNVHEKGLQGIIDSPSWRSFIAAGFEYCRYCPTHLHFHIPISTSLRKILPLLVKNPAYEQKSIAGRIREALWQ
ncbi:MAG: radical SAM protein [Candidatus Eisenbacteria bacterium]